LDKNPFITDQTQISAPFFLLKLAKKSKKVARVAIAYCQSTSAIVGAKQAYDEGLMEPVFVGDKSIIEKEAMNLGWDISGFRIIPANEEEKAGDIAAAVCGNGEADILMKGDLHSDVFMRSVIARKNNLRTRSKIVHQFYISSKDGEKGIMISDAAVNIKPSESTLKAITEKTCESLNMLGVSHPKIAFLSASETVMDNMESTLMAKKLNDWAQSSIDNAKFSGPLALDLIVSKEAAVKKGLINNPVAGQADGIIVPEIVSGNTLYKSLVYFASGCAAGIVLGAKVPVLLTSRADPPSARLASIALGSIFR
jgi:phosphate acetyltransferase